MNLVSDSVTGDILPENIIIAPIETGISDGIVIEIVSGLEKGDHVVTKMGALTAEQDSQEGTSGLFDNTVRVPGSGMRR